MTGTIPTPEATKQPPATPITSLPIALSVPNAPVHPFTTLDALSAAAQAILITILATTYPETRNQYIIVTNLPQPAIAALFNDKDALSGISFRFSLLDLRTDAGPQFAGSADASGRTGLLKIIPNYINHAITQDIILAICDALREQGVEPTEFRQPDECFWPDTRRPSSWPTLVIETGLTESLSRLQRDAVWWLRRSEGETRVVLVVTVNARNRVVQVEKWGWERTGDGEFHCLLPKVVFVRPSEVIGEPLCIGFRELMDREPVSGEADLVIRDELRIVARHI
ncbi:hypothetical protein BJY04DRAFT_216276 [Aspergillus karnatakaensis]|uniref:uncharacterized protein n=1 Tax=Aspergillus karnatakaensis TaxID=1810916 RepID=UPI003CCD6BCF